MIQLVASMLMVLLLACGALAAEASGAAEPGPGDRVFVVPIHGEVNDLTGRFVVRCIEQATAAGATTIVFDMDTPGGMISSAMQISGAIKRSSVRTLAWVHNDALSAGSLISLACNAIVTAPRGKIGDCAPIMIGLGGIQPLGQTERAKIDSYILAEFRDSATKAGYSERLCEAMVELGPAIWQIKNPTTAEVKYVFQNDLPAYGIHLTADQLHTLAVRPPTSTVANGSAKKPGDGWVIERRVLAENKLLTLTADEAVRYGFAKAVVSSDHELMQYLHGDSANLHRFEPSWSEGLVAWLTSPIVRGVLGVILLVSIYAAMHAPGMGLSEAAAIAAALLLFGAPYLAGLASATDLLLVLVGFVLIALEVFVIPGFGITGILGITLVLTGLVMTFVPPEPGGAWWPQLEGTWAALRQGMVTVTCSVVASAGLMMLLSRWFGKLPVFNRLVLQAATAGDLPGAVTVVEEGDEPRVRIGATGKVTSKLRPSGWVEIDGRPIDVVTHGEWIERGCTVRVIAVEGNRVVVESVSDPLSLRGRGPG